MKKLISLTALLLLVFVSCKKTEGPAPIVPVLATITTTTVSDITSIAAASGGEITNDGGASITQRGICYNTSANPTTANTKVASGSGTGSFIANMAGLAAGTTYYVRAYAINSAGTAYGNELSFKTASILAIITTTTVSDITSTTATSGGNITNDGGASITERGICYDTTANPTPANGKVVSGSGTGSFTANMTGLAAGTTYFVRAYAINSAGTAYGNEVSFKTASTLAIITTTTASAVTSTAAVSGGEITSDGGASITERGICYNTSANPTTTNSKVANGSGTGSFTANMTGLSSGTTYYIRAYAINSAGTAYGNEVSFKTASTLAAITTKTVSAITSTAASSGGDITNDGGASITERGICYNTTPGPTTVNNKVISSSGTGSFTTNMTGLAAGTTYYVRAYAINNAGTAYGNELIFKTLALATITTKAASTLGPNSYASGASITSDGGTYITESGICYSTTTNPTTADGKKISGYHGIATWNDYLFGLLEGTIYYIRAYAINGAGTAYGNEVIAGVDNFACVGQGWQGATPYNPTKTGIHPIMYYSNPFLPQEWQTSTLGLVELIVCEAAKYQTVQTCYYTGGKIVWRETKQLDLTLREAKTGNIIATKTFYSGYPESCPSTTIYGGSVVGKINYDEINIWLQSYVVK